MIQHHNACGVIDASGLLQHCLKCSAQFGIFTPQVMRKGYQDLYTKLSPFQKIQFSENTSTSSSRSKSFSEMDGKQKAAMIGGAVLSLGGAVGGAVLGGKIGGIGSYGGAMLGGQLTGQLSGFISSLAPNEQLTTSSPYTSSSTVENKTVTDMLSLLDALLKKTDEYDSYGMWNAAGYFISDDMSAAEIAASNYNLVSKSKAKILDMAIRGQLLQQNPSDEPASVLLERIRAEKEHLIKSGKIKRDKKESIIFRGDDNSYYEKVGKTSTCIDDELPFKLPENWSWCRLGNICSSIQYAPYN